MTKKTTKKTTGEKTSKTIGKLASKALKKPSTLTDAEIRRLGGSALTQRPDKAAKPPAKKATKKKKR
jgi:hypothetical protein